MKIDEQITRFHRYLAGEACAAEVSILNNLLSEDAKARALFLQVATHAQAQAQAHQSRPAIHAILISAAAAVALLFTVWALRPDSPGTMHSTASHTNDAWQDAFDLSLSEPTPDANLDTVSLLPLDLPCITRPTLDGISIFATHPVQDIVNIENLTFIQS